MKLSHTLAAVAVLGGTLLAAPAAQAGSTAPVAVDFNGHCRDWSVTYSVAADAPEPVRVDVQTAERRGNRLRRIHTVISETVQAGDSVTFYGAFPRDGLARMVLVNLPGVLGPSGPASSGHTYWCGSRA